MHVLSRDAEVALFRRSQDGDKSAEDELIVLNLPLVKHFAARFRGNGVDRDDLIQEGTLGLIDAVRGFDLTLDVKLSTYAGMLISQSMVRVIEKNRRRVDCGGSPVVASLPAPVEPNHLECADALSCVARTIGELTIVEREVIRLKLAGETLAGISAKTGRSKMGVRRAKKRAIDKLRAWLNPAAA